MTPTDLGLEADTVTFWDLDDVEAERTLDDRSMREDLAQVSLAKGVVLDIGWYGGESSPGAFVVMVVAAKDWDKPVFRESVASAEGLADATKRALEAAGKLA